MPRQTRRAQESQAVQKCEDCVNYVKGKGQKLVQLTQIGR